MNLFVFRFSPVCRSLFGGLALSAGALLAGCGRPATATLPTDYLLYIGTNVGGAQDSSIFLYRVNAGTGAFTKLGGQLGGANPTYLTLTPNHRFLYAVSETQAFRGAPGGGVSSFAIDPHSGALKLLGQQPSGGASPCYISLDRSGKSALVANYMGGNVSILPVATDGLLGLPTTDQHTGSGPHKNQNASHAHCLLPDPANKFAFAVNLGTDQVVGYRLDAPAGRLARLPEAAFVAKPGAGPRHLTFHPNGRFAYLINELNSTLTTLAYDAATGHFRELQTLPTLPAGYTGDNSCADVHVAPNGLFLYASNRGHNSIAVFAIDSGNGTLVPIQDVDTQGKTPRNFALDPSGRLLLVANQNSNNLVSYRVDAFSGLLTPTGQQATVPSPMFVGVVEDFRK